ncbi:MAG: ATP-dependent RNA helicase HrpA [Betaproteobacteria bacterium]|nr:ATP-dependent RNA helicase HrpA [Betaproteobacteria bacterium]
MKPASRSRIDLTDVLPADRARLIALQRKPNAQEHAIEQALTEARARFDQRETRRAQFAHPTFDDALPIAERRSEIAALIEKHQVVIVCGETGSGKTTQLPKICLELGRGRNGMIGCTQPRRIAARSLATRLAKELGAAGQHAVGYKIRFNDQTDDNTFVKVMTDGILLAETHSDRNLWRYDTLIIDEAHERSLNIDFLLGYVKRLLSKRQDMKVIVTSATIDPQRFSRHFSDAPVIEVSGRTYPVEVRYRPEHLLDDSDDEVPIEDAVSRAVDEVFLDSREGDILVFLPGEREIRDTAEALRKHSFDKSRAAMHGNVEVLPLYSRLSNAEQDRVFQTGGKRRIVLATNVAETSLTVPGIKYVIDAGLARIKRYSARSKINQLQIEPISQASAKQRAGRCGRVAAGIAIRLYGEEELAARPEFTTPEILRTSLADVILRMMSLGLGDIADFPFVEPPSPRMIEDGYRQLFELGAVDVLKNLTQLGRQLAKFPVDPAIARMLVAANDGGVLHDVLIIAAALSVQDPRLRPHDKQQESMLAHEKFAHPTSEFLAYVNLWNFVEESWKHKKSNRKFDEMLHANFVSPLRVREWRDVHAQLAEVCASVGFDVRRMNIGDVSTTANPPAAASGRRPPFSKGAKSTAPFEKGGRERSERGIEGGSASKNATAERVTQYEAIHRALLTGLITNVGTKAHEGDHYLGPRALTFYLPKRLREHAAQKEKRLKWLMAAELTETTRVYARTVAAIEPEWIEDIAPHLLTRNHFDPHWERKSGQVIAFEQVSLYGLIVNPKRRVTYGNIDAKHARELFIRQGLAAGEIDTRGEFLLHNLKLVGEVEEIEAKARRQDILIDEDELFALYDAVVPVDVHNAAGFERWRKDAERANPKILKFERDQFMRRGAGEVTFELYPRTLKLPGMEFALSYRFEPGHALDGVTVTLPVSVVNQVNAHRFDWLTPGLLREKAGLLMKSLPQRFRSQLVPLPESVTDFLDFAMRAAGMQDLSAVKTPLIDALIEYLLQRRGMSVAREDFDPARLPPYLTMNVRVVDADGKELTMSRYFAAIRAEYAEQSRTVFSTLHSNRLEREGLTRWDFGDLPETVNFEKNRVRYDGFPALTDDGASVSIKIFDDKEAARQSHREGLARLAMLENHEQARFLIKGFKFSPVAAFQFAHFFPDTKNHTQDAMREESGFAAFVAAFVDDVIEREGRDIRTVAGHDKARAYGKTHVNERATQIARALEESLTAAAAVREKLADRYVKNWEHIGPDIESQLANLFAPHFLRAVPAVQLLHYPRYVKAAALRLDKAKAGDMERDLESYKQLRALWHNALQMPDPSETAAARYRWMIEELRVSLFAQELRTPYPVSVKRAAKMWEELQE